MAVATNSKTQIPADWRQVSLGDVLTLEYGVSLPEPESTEPRCGGTGKGREGRGDPIAGADLGQTGPVADGGGRGALLMEGPEAAGNAGWPIWHTSWGDV